MARTRAMTTLLSWSVRGRVWMQSTAPWYAWAALAALWVFFAWFTLETRIQYVPDSRYYVAMTYRMLGESEEAAREHTIPLNEGVGFPTPSTETLFHWGLVQPRVVYPALSAPFVALLGPHGMVVVPVLAMAVLCFGAFAYVARRHGVAAGLVPVALVTMSSYMMFFGTAMLTESLAAALVLGMLATLPLRGPRGRGALIALGVLTVVLAFTRQTWMLPVAAIGVAWLGEWIRARRFANRWLPFVIVSGVAGVVCQVAQSIAWPSFSIIWQLKRAAGVDTLGEAIPKIPGMAWNVFITDGEQFLLYDRPLLVLLAGALVCAIVLWRRPESHLYVGALAAGGFLNAINGTPTQFRYEMPALAFVILVVGAGVGLAGRRVRHWRRQAAPAGAEA